MRTLDELLRAGLRREIEQGGPRPDLWERVHAELFAKPKPRSGLARRLAVAAALALALLVALPGPRTIAIEWVRAILLPNGRAITHEQLTPLDHSLAEVQVIAVARAGDPVLQAVGNRALVLRREEVSIPAGDAILALVERSEPAASGSTAVQHEYWLIVLRPHPQREDMLLAHALIATVTGDEQAARAEILRVAQAWEVP